MYLYICIIFCLFLVVIVLVYYFYCNVCCYILLYKIEIIIYGLFYWNILYWINVLLNVFCRSFDNKSISIKYLMKNK